MYYYTARELPSVYLFILSALAITLWCLRRCKGLRALRFFFIFQNRQKGLFLGLASFSGFKIWRFKIVCSLFFVFILCLLFAGPRAGEPPSGEHGGEGLRHLVPEVHLPVPIRELQRALQQRVPGKLKKKHKSFRGDDNYELMTPERRSRRKDLSLFW